MEKIKNNFIYAIKNIRYHLKDYSCFFIAVFVIQTVLGIISFCYYNNNVNILLLMLFIGLTYK